MTINIYGNYEVFPTGTVEKQGTYAGLEITYRELESRSYFDKIVLVSGIPYLILFIFSIVAYVILSLAHFEKLKVLNKCAIYMNPLNLKSVKFSNTLFYDPESYDPKRNKVYAECLLRLQDPLRENSRKSSKVVPTLMNDQNKTERILIHTGT